MNRQNSKHLGINGAQQIAGIAVSAGRNKRGQHEADVHTLDLTTPKGLKTAYWKLMLENMYFQYFLYRSR